MEPFGRIFYDGKGNAHERYGVDLAKPSAVIVRPDGWIGTMVDLTNEGAVKEIEAYFDRVLV